MQDTQTSGGGAVSAIPATLGDVALASASSARVSHSHPVEDVMGLDDRIDAKRLDAMPEIVIEHTSVISDPKNNVAYFGAGTLIPKGVYVGRTTASMEVLSGTAGSGTIPRCTLSNGSLAFVTIYVSGSSKSLNTSSSSSSTGSESIFIMYALSDAVISDSSLNSAFVVVSNVQNSSSYEVTGRIELRKLI